MEKEITIGIPRIVHINSKCRLEAPISMFGKEHDLYFEFDEEYAPYVCQERSDSFVLMLFTLAMYEKANLICEAPVTEELHYQLTNYQIPIMADAISEYHSIEIKAPLADEIPCEVNAHVAAFSAGVDSFYTVLSNLHPVQEKMAITHLIFNNVGALTKDQATSEQIFLEKRTFFEKAAHDLNLPLIAINTNILELLKGYPDMLTSPDTFKNAGCLYALKRLANIFYWSGSGAKATEITVKYDDMAAYDVLNTSFISTRDFRMYVFDLNASRLDKVKYIANSPIAQKYLSVCDGLNDSTCFKCTRTMFELYSIGKLDKFSEVFDIQFFYDNLADRIAYSIGDTNEKRHKYSTESLAECRKNGVKIPIATWFLAYLKYRPLLFFKKKLKDVKFVRQFYEKHDLRRKLKFQG